MSTTTTEPQAERPAARPLGSLALAGAASLGAGAIHAAAIGVHSEHRQAVITFTIVAALQIGWGAAALVRRSLPLAAAGVVVNVAAVGGWAMAKASGIPFVEGLDEAEAVQFADAAAATLAATAAVLAIAQLVGTRLVEAAPRVAGAGMAALAVLAFPAMVSAGSHSHAGAGHGDEGGHAHGDSADADLVSMGESHQDHPTAVPPKPYDPTKPIDLGGVEGVSLEQQARAENLISITLLRLPQFADHTVAEAQGYRSIGDGLTGYEHFINWGLISDGRILDPDYPESLVYRYDRATGERTLEAAMFMTEPGVPLDEVPELGGPITQWHVHEDLCFTSGGNGDGPRVGGVIEVGGECPPPLVKFPATPMIHVWIVPHKCGPFAALEGVGAGQIAEGEERLCDTAHGH